MKQPKKTYVGAAVFLNASPMMDGPRTAFLSFSSLNPYCATAIKPNCHRLAVTQG
jgi:hypothetical protein